MTPLKKAELLANTFAAKVVLPDSVVNEFSLLQESPEQMGSCCLLRVRAARKILADLVEKSGTGPDLLPSLILKRCAAALAIPFVKLARRIINTGILP